MGAMVMNFALAVEHASDSDQILDVDYDGAKAVYTWHVLEGTGGVLRDMDAQRFSFLLDQLWKGGSVNKVEALDGRASSGAPAPPQNVLGHGAAPQIFLGGEVDALPELEATFSS